jgi:alkanesulfonate monooxygenase SsuD/methylene tetrahydromethanopterin reductase-like flavin-dependent oxidoreductase (luciferase family)
MARLRQGRPGLYPTPEEAADHEFTPLEREIARSWAVNHVIGDAQQVRSDLEELVERTHADELMITTIAHDPDHRLRSYRMVAEAMALEPVG